MVNSIARFFLHKMITQFGTNFPSTSATQQQITGGSPQNIVPDNPGSRGNQPTLSVDGFFGFLNRVGNVVAQGFQVKNQIEREEQQNKILYEQPQSDQQIIAVQPSSFFDSKEGKVVIYIGGALLAAILLKKAKVF